MKVLTFGTFDLLHEGHKYYLTKAKSYGDRLFAVVARDSTVKKIKGFFPDENENERLKKVMETGIPDEAVLGGKANPYEILKTIRPDVICLGYDQTAFIEKLEEELRRIGLLKTKIVRIDSHKPEIYKSSKMRKNKKR